LSSIIDAFDRSAYRYDDWYDTPKGMQVLKSELKAVDSLIPSHGVGLEMGAGTGVFAERLTTDERVVVCLDPSAGMLGRSRERDLISIIASGYRPPFKLMCVDFVYLVTVLEFLEEPSMALRMIARLLKPDAPMVVLTINSESEWGSFYERLGREGNLIFSNSRLYNYEEARAIMEEAGLVVTESFGTVTSGPEDPEAGDEKVEPGPMAGVLLFRTEVKK
jgi:ubiquinone/menaquinone biosynthesis C-methylase UbiE